MIDPEEKTTSITIDPRKFYCGYYPESLCGNLTVFSISANPLSRGIASISTLAWSPDGNEIASSVHLFSPVLTFRAIIIWNSHTGVAIKQLLGHVDDVYDVAWSPDGKYLASLAQDQDNTVRLWNVTTGQQIYAVQPVGYGVMERLAWSPDGQYLAVQMQAQVGNNTLGTIVTRDEVQVWKALTHQLVTTFPSPSAGYTFGGFSWAPDSRRIVTAIGSAALDKGVHIWNATTGQNLYTFQGKYPEEAGLVAWSPDGKYIVQTALQQISLERSVNVTEVWLAPAGMPGSTTTSTTP